MRAHKRPGFRSWLLASLPLLVAGALAAGDVQAQSAASSANSKTKTSQSSKTAAKPAKTAATTKTAASSTSAKSSSSRRAGKRIQAGSASWYGPGFHGRKTANGERFDMYELTAAHRTLPLGTKVRVVNPSNGKEVVVRINDRGPYAHGRILDLSKAAAGQLGLIARGHGDVVLHALHGEDDGEGTGLSTTRVAAAQADVKPTVNQKLQAEVLAKTRFGDSKQVLGTAADESHPQMANSGESLRGLPAELAPPVGLVASQGGLGFDVSRAGYSGLPWGRTEWDQREQQPSVAAAAPPAPVASMPTATPWAAAAVVGSMGAAQRLQVPSDQLQPAAYLPVSAPVDAASSGVLTGDAPVAVDLN